MDKKINQMRLSQSQNSLVKQIKNQNTSFKFINLCHGSRDSLTSKLNVYNFDKTRKVASTSIHRLETGSYFAILTETSCLTN